MQTFNPEHIPVTIFTFRSNGEVSVLNEWYMDGGECRIFKVDFSDRESWSVRIPIHVQSDSQDATISVLRGEQDVLQEIGATDFPWGPQYHRSSLTFENLTANYPPRLVRNKYLIKSLRYRYLSSSVPKKDARYETILATQGSFMGKSELGVLATNRSSCRALLETDQLYRDDSFFRDDLFEETCERVRNKNEARIVRDISPLTVPPAEVLALRGAKHLKLLIESVNEGWNSSILITKTCKVKCGGIALDVADRQNAHSMTLALRGLMELFRLVKREKELYREILAFSVLHDHQTVRIYGLYPVIDREKTSFYRDPI